MASGLFRAALVLSLGIATTVVLAMLVSQAAYISPAAAVEALSSPAVRNTIALSLLTASTAALLALVVAVPSAYLLARHKFFGKPLVDALLDVPVIMSPVALGLALLLVFRTAPGEWVERHLLRFVFEVPGIVLAQFILALALAIRVLKATFEEINPRLEQVARCMGCSPGRAFLHVTLPLARPGLIAALVLGWALHCDSRSTAHRRCRWRPAGTTGPMRSPRVVSRSSFISAPIGFTLGRAAKASRFSSKVACDLADVS